MPVNLTLKSIPDTVYERLKASAQINHRSINSEAIARLEAQLVPSPGQTRDNLQAIREIRSRLPKVKFDHREIDAIKRAGRS
jgi:plasmid stability protein